MRLCLVSREYPPEFLVGGIGTYTHHVGRALASRGHEVHVVTETRQADRVGEEDGVVVHRLESPSGLLKEQRMLSHARRVAAEVGSIGPVDAVQACEYGAEGIALARERRTPLVTRLATPRFLVDEIEGRRDLRSRLFAQRWEREQTLASRLVISSTHALARRVGLAWGIEASSIQIVPNALDLSRIRSMATAGRELPPPPASRYLIYFGRLEERKGVHLLARALASILAGDRTLWAVFAGADRPYAGGSMRSYIEGELREVRERVVIHDLLPPARLLPYVAGASLAVLPSLWEAFGFVCLEAMALGTPVLATSGSGFEEIIADGVSGSLVPPGSAEVIAQRLRSLLAAPALLARLGEAGRAAAEQFDTGRICEKLEALYAGLGRAG